MKQRNDTIDSENCLLLRDQFLAGDNSAYTKLYKMYSTDLYAFGLSLRFKTPLIEDAIHDVFEEIYLHRHNLRNIENLKYYFVAAFRHRLFFLLKKELNTAENIETTYVAESTEKDYLDTWIERENETERELLIKNLMSELNANQREVIYHRYVEELSLDEIATLMNINYQSVKNLICRSLKKMNKLKATTLFLLLTPLLQV